MRSRRLKVVWLLDALDDLKEIYDYIYADSPRAARKIVNQLRSAPRHLSRFPLMGRIVPELPDSGLRELIVGKYRIIYRPSEHLVEILLIVHGSRDFPAVA